MRVRYVEHDQPFPAALRACAQPRLAHEEIRAGLTGAGHELVDADEDVLIIDVNRPDVAPQLARARVPVVLSSLCRPLGPWWAEPDDEDERQALIQPWSADQSARRMASRPLLATAYADDLRTLTEAIASVQVEHQGPMRYLGALFGGMGKDANGKGISIGSSLPLPEGQDVVLGRGRSADLLLPVNTVARHHVRVRWANATLALQDLGGTNPNWVRRSDGTVVRIESGQHLALGAGDLLILADSFRFAI